jgi:tetratricopeptide (TPR) repeat protein
MATTLQQAKVLVIDDFQGMRTMLRNIIRDMGVSQVETASNGREAIQQLRHGGYDIVICDFNLGPGPNGQQVLEEARYDRLIGVSTIWVMVTAEKTSDMVMGAAEVKPDDYVLKPINQGMLETRLTKLITRKNSLHGIETAIKGRDYAAAIAQCDQQLQANPANLQELLRIKSDLLLSTGAYPAAKALFDSVLATRSVPWARTGLGRVLFYTREFAGAKIVFQQVLAENRMYMEASDWLARTLDALGEFEQAQQVLLEAVKLSPNSAMRQKNLGDVAYRNGALDVAQSAFEKTIKVSEHSARKNPAVYAGLAKVFSDKGEPEGALKVLDQSRKTFKDNPEAALQTALAESVVYKGMGQTDKAQQALAGAEELMQSLGGKVHHDTQLEMAKSLFKLGEKDKASAMLQAIVKNNHESVDIQRQVQAIFESEGLGEEGLTLIQKSRDEVVGINNQGVTLAKAGDFEGGIKLLRQALEQMPNSETIMMNLCGLLLGAMNRAGKNPQQAEEARTLLERVRELNPDNKKRQDFATALERIVGV